MHRFSFTDMGNLAQILIAIISSAAFFISVLTLIILYCNLGQFWKQNRLTQTLNRPLCGIKDILVNHHSVSSTPDIPVIGIEALIVNSGNDAARDVMFTYEIYALDAKQNSKTVITSKKPTMDHRTWVLMPRHEVKTFLLYIQKKDFDQAVIGYDKVALLDLTLEYKDTEGKAMKYSSTYSITRLLTDKDMKVYEISLRESKLTE